MRAGIDDRGAADAYRDAGAQQRGQREANQQFHAGFRGQWQDSIAHKPGQANPRDGLRAGIGYRRRCARMYSKASGKSENAMIATITSAKLSCTSGSLPNR